MSKDAFRVRSLHAQAVTAVDAVSTRAFARHAHDEFGIGLMVEGAQRSWSGRGAVEAVSGNLITVNPAELHDGTPVGSQRRWSMLYFSQPLVRSIVGDIEEGRRFTHELQAPVIDDPRLADRFVKLRNAALHPLGESAFEENMLLLFGDLLGRAESSTNAPIGRLSQVRERIDNAPARSHALADLAALAGLSLFQTVRGFSRLTGLTPHAYVVQRRLGIARGLIRQGVALAEAADEAGFSDQSHMHRIFVARHGFTPGAYARALHRPRAISFKNEAR